MNQLQIINVVLNLKVSSCFAPSVLIRNWILHLNHLLFTSSFFKSKVVSLIASMVNDYLSHFWEKVSMWCRKITSKWKQPLMIVLFFKSQREWRVHVPVHAIKVAETITKFSQSLIQFRLRKLNSTELLETLQIQRHKEKSKLICGVFLEGIREKYWHKTQVFCCYDTGGYFIRFFLANSEKSFLLLNSIFSVQLISY